MSENPQESHLNPENSSQPDSADRNEWRSKRREERWARGGRRRGAWIGGAVLILIGVMVLLQNLGLPYLENWWALFVLLPAFGSFAAAWRIYQEGGRMNAAAYASIIFGLVLTAVTAVLLFSLSWSWFGPGILILAGLGLLATVLLPK